MPLLEPLSVGLDLGGRRFCRRCTSLLPTSLGRDVHRLVTPDESKAAYGHLPPAAFKTAVAWCRTVDETHQVGRIILDIYGPPPMSRRCSPERQEIYKLHRALVKRRDTLRVRELSDEDRAEQVARREDETAEHARLVAAKKREDRATRAHDRHRRGEYVPLWDRPLIGA